MFKIKNVNSTHTKFYASYGNVKITHTFLDDCKMLQNIENLREKLQSFMGYSNIDSIYITKKDNMPAPLSRLGIQCILVFVFPIFKRLFVKN